MELKSNYSPHKINGNLERHIYLNHSYCDWSSQIAILDQALDTAFVNRGTELLILQSMCFAFQYFCQKLYLPVFMPISIFIVFLPVFLQFSIFASNFAVCQTWEVGTIGWSHAQFTDWPFITQQWSIFCNMLQDVISFIWRHTITQRNETNL